MNRFISRDLSISKINRWPDWKNRNGSKYESPKILGKMFRKINECLHSVNLGWKQSNQLIVPDKITQLLTDYRDEAMESQVSQSLKEYIQNRAYYSLNMDLEHFFEWRKNYLSFERGKFVLDKKNPSKVALLDAAFIYQKCIITEREDTACNACEFAWGVCFEELIDIFAGKNKIYVSCEAQRFLLKY
jgi:hypothetical protein